MYKSVLLLSSIMFITSVSNAQNSCIDLFTNSSFPVAANQNSAKMEIKKVEELTGEAKRKQEFEAIAQHLSWEFNKWNLLVGPFAVHKVGLQLMDRTVLASYFHPTERYIALGLQTEGKHETVREVVLAHEYSHAIFNDNFVFEYQGEMVSMKKLSMDAKTNMDSLNANPNYKLMVEEINEINRTLQLARKVDAKDHIADLESMLKHKIEALTPMTRAADTFQVINDILISYNELFADSLPAILWKDPHIMKNAVEHSGAGFLELLQYELMYRGRNRNGPAPRDFELSSFKDWKHEVADAYTLLDPARGVLWTMYLKNLRAPEIPLFLQTFLEATSLHVSERLKSNKDLRVSSQADDAVQINKEFIRIFVETAEKNELPIRK